MQVPVQLKYDNIYIEFKSIMEGSWQESEETSAGLNAASIMILLFCTLTLTSNIRPNKLVISEANTYD